MASKKMSTAIRGYFTTKEAAAYTGYSTNTIKRYAAEGILHALRPGRDLLFPKSELDRYLRERNPVGNPTFRRAN